ncbi:hypothetical protein Y032_0033g2747 [Ancylostoma ceylanicum]|uniref:Uncharacterized protein n=1 Tax=Ancylostoma ceylanicum TaxID=53326 RepID=A0A016UQ56_9BILA|nr:hypothetical protein Y032_0033g2747 [Ancylostoma ceylanicum]
MRINCGRAVAAAAVANMVAAILPEEYSTLRRRRRRQRPPVAISLLRRRSLVGDAGSLISATDCEIPTDRRCCNSRQHWRRSVASIGDRPSPMLATKAADVGGPCRRRRRPPRRPAHNRCASASQSPATANRGAILHEDYSGSVSAIGGRRRRRLRDWCESIVGGPSPRPPATVKAMLIDCRRRQHWRPLSPATATQGAILLEEYNGYLVTTTVNSTYITSRDH